MIQIAKTVLKIYLNICKLCKLELTTCRCPRDVSQRSILNPYKQACHCLVVSWSFSPAQCIAILLHCNLCTSQDFIMERMASNMEIVWCLSLLVSVMYLTILIRPATTDNITTSAATTFCVTSYDPFYAIIIIVITGIYSEKKWSRFFSRHIQIKLHLW